jgi:hypothetical protein
MLEGPRSRTRELIQLLRVTSDFLREFPAFHFTDPCVAVFGSARIPERHPSEATHLDQSFHFTA